MKKGTIYAIKLFKSKGYKKLLLQIGRGELQPETEGDPSFEIEFYRYKDSIADDIKKADLVISHAGAGSILETLGAQKPLIVVINEELMDNHQLEVADQLNKDNHLFYCTCSTLAITLKELDISKLKSFPPGEPQKFASFLDKFMGVS